MKNKKNSYIKPLFMVSVSIKNFLKKIFLNYRIKINFNNISNQFHGNY